MSQCLQSCCSITIQCGCMKCKFWLANCDVNLFFFFRLETILKLMIIIKLIILHSWIDFSCDSEGSLHADITHSVSAVRKICLPAHGSNSTKLHSTPCDLVSLSLKSNLLSFTNLSGVLGVWEKKMYYVHLKTQRCLAWFAEFPNTVN